MKKKVFVMGILVIIVSLLTGCSKELNASSNNDALAFKEDYESLNGKETSTSGVLYRSIKIPENNPIIYSTFEEVAKKIENKETFIVYVGFSACPWCRSVIPYVLESAKENNVDKIYYVNVREDNTRESDLRGYYKLDANNKVVIDVYPDKYYHTVLNTLDEFLKPYTLETTKGKTIETGENRLYAPSFIVYKDGVAVALDECISASQTDGYQELNDDIKSDIKNKADTLFKAYNES
jgi:thiol-disulfide isomerase/thioredoxin